MQGVKGNTEIFSGFAPVSGCDGVLAYLLNKSSKEDGARGQYCSHHEAQESALQARLASMDISDQLHVLHRQLCILPPSPPLPESVLVEIDNIILHRRAQRLLYPLDGLQPAGSFKRQASQNGRIILWRGDITTLSNVTAITNAANGQGLGCFQPSHRCIDNVIHSAAGPRLRLECAKIMETRNRQLEPGETIITKGYCLPSSSVIHVVGPCLAPNASPTEADGKQLSNCYRSVLEAVEALPISSDGQKSVALCGISTGLFAFPVEQAARIAVDTVHEWLNEHQQTTITDIIFNTFTATEDAVYQKLLSPSNETHPPASLLDNETTITCDSMDSAREWLRCADAVIVSAGAGLSAADGLDYTSQELFAKRFPGFLKYGLRTLYSVFGFKKWPTELDRWGYYFTHLNMVREWPISPIYQPLIGWLEKFGPEAHVRTSNADGLFLANGWSSDKLSTPQGSYAVLQCLENCRPDSTVLTEPYLLKAAPVLDPVSQRLTRPELIPVCRFCKGKMHICVRADSWFNSGPFEEGEVKWRAFRRRALEESKQVVILEVGVGMSTPGVLRWPNEKLVRHGKGNVKLIRIGLGHESAVPRDLDENELALSINGDIALVFKSLFR